MPKKKKKTATKRIGGFAASLKKNGELIGYGAIAAGFLLGDKINAAIDKATGDKIDSKIVAAGQAGLGAMLVFNKSTGKGSMVKKIVGGIALGSGVKRGMTAFGLGNIGGYQNVPAVGGYQNVPAVGYATQQSQRVGYTPAQGGMNGYGSRRGAAASFR